MSTEDPLKGIPQIDQEEEPTKFIRVSVTTHTKIATLGRILTNASGKHHSHNDTISEMLEMWEADSGTKL
jgi:hypothetical protein